METKHVSLTIENITNQIVDERALRIIKETYCCHDCGCVEVVYSLAGCSESKVIDGYTVATTVCDYNIPSLFTSAKPYDDEHFTPPTCIRCKVHQDPINYRELKNT